MATFLERTEPCGVDLLSAFGRGVMSQDDTRDFEFRKIGMRPQLKTESRVLFDHDLGTDRSAAHTQVEDRDLDGGLCVEEESAVEN